MTNNLVTARCSDEVICLFDKVGKMYGMSRAELMRTGAIQYCQQLLMTDTMQRVNDLCQSLSSTDISKLTEKDKHNLAMIDQITQMLVKGSGL